MDLLTSAIEPYLLYLKIAAVIIAVAAVIAGGFYVRHVFNDRARLQTENGSLSARLVVKDQQMEALQAGYERVARMQEEIQHAIAKVKIDLRSDIQSIDTAPPPSAVDGAAVVLVPGGLLPRVSVRDSLPGFDNHSTCRTGAPPASRGGDQTRWGVLPERPFPPGHVGEPGNLASVGHDKHDGY